MEMLVHCYFLFLMFELQSHSTESVNKNFIMCLIQNMQQTSLKNEMMNYFSKQKRKRIDLQLFNQKGNKWGWLTLSLYLMINCIWWINHLPVANERYYLPCGVHLYYFWNKCFVLSCHCTIFESLHSSLSFFYAAYI